MSNTTWVKLLTATLGTVLWHTVAWAAGPLSVEQAWVRDAPPHAEMSAGYLTLINQSDQPQVLTGVTSPQFAKVEVHKTEIINNQVHMQREDEVNVPAHGRVAFAPGGYHLMLIHPRHELKLGDSVELHLQFKGAATLTVHAPVQESADVGSSHDMHDMHM